MAGQRCTSRKSRRPARPAMARSVAWNTLKTKRPLRESTCSGGPDRPRLRANPTLGERRADCAPRRGACAAGADPPCAHPCPPWPLRTESCAAAGRAYRLPPGPRRCVYSERCCGMPASSALTSVSRYRRCPPRVRMEVSFPALAHRVTVFGSTRNMVATSAGVSKGSASGVRADMLTASPPGPVLRSCDPAFLALDVPYGLLRPYCHHQR
jgi:hypothetical protein